MTYWDDHPGEAIHILRELYKKTDRIERKLNDMGQGLSNLQADVLTLRAAVAKILADLSKALQNDDPDAAVAAADLIVRQATADLQAGDPGPGSTSTSTSTSTSASTSTGPAPGLI